MRGLGLSFRVKGEGFRVVLGFRVRVRGLGFRVEF